MTPDAVAKAARAELVIHEEDRPARPGGAAERAARLAPVDQLFGSRLRVIRQEDAG